MNGRIVAIGLSCHDHIVRIPELSSAPKGVRALEVLAQGGGVAATAAVCARKLGAEVELWTRVGADRWGEFLMEEFCGYGLDLSQSRVVEGAETAVSTVLVEEGTGERVFLYRPARGLERAEEPDYSRLDRARCLLVDGRWEKVCERAVERALALGIPVVCDVGHLAPHERWILEKSTYPVLARDVADGYGGGSQSAAAKALLEYSARAVVVTLGQDGSVLYEPEGEERIPAFEVDVVDTTGAGDVFHGAFAFGVAAGLSPRECVVLATGASALKCTRLGGRTGIPDLSTLLAFLRERRAGVSLSV